MPSRTRATSSATIHILRGGDIHPIQSRVNAEKSIPRVYLVTRAVVWERDSITPTISPQLVFLTFSIPRSVAKRANDGRSLLLPWISFRDRSGLLKRKKKKEETNIRRVPPMIFVPTAADIICTHPVRNVTRENARVAPEKVSPCIYGACAKFF